jgi:hypothetical protein
MTSQLVAFATQARKASGLEFDELDELDEPDELDELDEDPDPHMFLKASRQLPLCLERELELLELEPQLEDDPAKQAPHLAMMLSTALSQFDFSGGQPVTVKRAMTNPRRASFIIVPPRRSCMRAV